MFRIPLANNEEISRTPCSCNIDAVALDIQTIYERFPSDNLVLYFPCNDTYNLTDVINGVTLTNTGSVSYKQESWKTSERCVSTNGDTETLGYFSINKANFVMPSTFTLMCMLKPINVSSTSVPVVEIGSQYRRTGFGIWMTTTNQLCCRINNTLYTAGTSITSEWHHAALVYDKQQAILYVDGEEYTISKFTIDPKTPNYTTEINIGSRYPGSDPKDPIYNQNYNGYIDDIRLYKYPMSQEEISRIFKIYVALSV